MLRLLLWAAAILGLVFGLYDLLAKASDGFAAPGWVPAAAIVCLASFAVLLLVTREA